MVNVAIFTDNDFEKVNGVTTTLKAVLAHAPPGLRLRVYTASRRGVDEPGYLALRSTGVPIPFYTEMRVYLPRLRAYRRRAREARIDLVHLTTPGPIGLAAVHVARRLRLPMVASFHTDLAAYASILSGSARLGGVVRAFMRWPYGRCTRVLVPSSATRGLPAREDGSGPPLEIWRRGVDPEQFQPARRSTALRARWGVSDARPAVIYVGRVSREKGLHLLPQIDARSAPGAWPAVSSSSATARCCPSCARPCPMRCSPARSLTPRWPRPSPRPTSSLSRAGPTPRATSYSRRRRAGCRCWSPTSEDRERTCRRARAASSSREPAPRRGPTRSHR